MKLDRTLSINNQPVPVVEERVLLKLNGPGAAQFVTDATANKAQPGQAVAFDIGYTRHAQGSRLFLGYVEKVTDMDRKRQFVLCRELANALALKCPIGLRHVSAMAVLKEVGAKTGLSFSIPAQSYSSERIPNFYNVGDGFQAMSQIARVYRIDDFIWQQQGNGVIYVGSWADSRWADRSGELPAELFDKQLASGSARIPAVPVLRPGVQLNGRRITRLDFKGNHMEIAWTTP